jgi:hypothetical protein
MSWLVQCGDRWIPRIREFFLLWFDAYGRISPLPNFSATEHQRVKAPCSSLKEKVSDPPTVRSGRHLTIVRVR